MTTSNYLFLIRHGETAWSKEGRHTSISEIPLTDAGKEQARNLGLTLREWTFDTVLCSPRERAKETCALAGLSAHATSDGDVAEWNYGEYEGLTRTEIRQSRPGWTIWNGGAVGGETIDEVATRADRVLSKISEARGNVAIVAHGHFLNVLAARTLSLVPIDGEKFSLLQPAHVGIFINDENRYALQQWNVSGPNTLS